jgi:hypothetical protein
MHGHGTTAGKVGRVRSRGGRLAATAMALGAAIAPATLATPAEATPTVPGATVTTTILNGSSLLATVTMTAPGALTVRCPSTTLRVNGADTGVGCAQIGAVRVLATAQTDSVDVDLLAGTAPRFSPYVSVELGAGNDVAKVLARARTDVAGGPGSDRLSVGADAAVAAQANVQGGDGDDILTNLGWVRGTPPALAPSAYYANEAILSGGPGADIVRGSGSRPDGADIDTTDSVSLGTGPATVWLATSQQTDLVTVHANGNYGPKVSVTRAGRTWSLALPTLTDSLQVDTLGGPDQITVDGKSARTSILFDTGSGTDALTIRPWPGYRWDRTIGMVTQPGAAPITYVAKRLESVTVKAL